MMGNLISGQLFNYIESLERSLGLPAEQSRSVIDEVRADLVLHVQRLVDAGHDETQAVGRAIEEMGPPEELAAQMRVAIPALNGAGLRVLRRVAMIAVSLLMLWVFWHIRAMEFGFSVWRVLGFAALSTPIILLISPDIIWRKNWMFTALPTVAIFALAVVAMSAGQASEATVISNPNATAPAIDLGRDLGSESGTNPIVMVALASLSVLTLYLFTQIQRRRQRLLAIMLTVMVVAMIEVPYAVEEQRYSSQLAELQTSLQSLKIQSGAYPSVDEFRSQQATVFKYDSRSSGAQYSLFYDRPLNPHYALCWASDRDRMWIND